MAKTANTADASGYSGPDRRRRRVYVTENHEYHCKDGICVAVREVGTGEFIASTAVGKQVSAVVRFRRNGGIESIGVPDEAKPGERMHFANSIEDSRDVLTGPLQSIERPEREVLARYERESA
jgi:hypothetical protein